MAAWLTHLRVAHKLIDYINITNESLYYAGCIAPDNEYPSDISHWCVSGDKSTCNVLLFFDEYINNKINDIDFYIGYYVHLFTDMYWQKNKIIPLLKQKKDIKEIKKRWNDVDICFLQKHQDYRPINMLKSSTNLEKLWFNYMNVNTIKSLVDHILQCRLNLPITYCDLEHEKEIDDFISDCASAFMSINSTKLGEKNESTKHRNS